MSRQPYAPPTSIASMVADPSPTKKRSNRFGKVLTAASAAVYVLGAATFLAVLVRHSGGGIASLGPAVAAWLFALACLALSLLELHAPSSLSSVRFCYVMTDHAEKTLEFWRRHEQLVPFVQRGFLDFSLFDVFRGQSILRVVSAPQLGVRVSWTDGQRLQPNTSG